MQELRAAIPDVDVLLSLSPEELASKLLPIIRRQEGRTVGGSNLISLLDEMWRSPIYPLARRDEIDVVIAEAWGWLIGQNLLVLNPRPGNHDWYRLSRRASQFEDSADLAQFAAAKKLPREMLHPCIAGNVWLSYMKSEFDTAVFQAMKAVEVAVRRASGLPDELVGVKLMRRAFDAETGPLADKEADNGERDACSSLFAGAIGMYKNPQSHRDVNIDDPAEAAGIIMLASNLLRIVDARKKITK